MKRILGLFVLALGSLSPAAADEARVASLEAEWGPLMSTLSPPALTALDAELTPQLGASSPAALWVKAGIVSHNLSRAVGNETNRGNAARAVERLKAAAHGPDADLAAVALPFLGSATTLMATEDANPVAKIFAVNNGWGLLSEAVDKYGDVSFLPRLVRARVASSLPDFFGKGAEVLKDLNALAAWDKAHPGRMTDGVRADLALWEGNAYKKQKDLPRAVAAWNRALVLDPQKVGSGKAAAEALDRYAD
jgi:tetratricopeptide (TPR) repeat protein